MSLKPVALVACLLLPPGSAWAQGSDRIAPSGSGVGTGTAEPGAGNARRTREDGSRSKADGLGENRGTAAKPMMDSVIGNGSGRADEDASAAAAR